MSTAEATWPSTATVWLDRVRSYAPLAATLLGILYASGFVIVNAYLGRYGIRELDALRTRYVGAGLLFLVFVLLAVAIAAEIRHDAQRRTGQRRVALFVLAVIVGPWFMALAEALTIVRVETGAFGTDVVDTGAALRLFLILAFANFALLVGLLLFEGAQSQHTGRPVERLWRGLTTWWLVIVVLGVALAWSEFVYPQIPAFLGGGRPEAVRLVTTQSVADACPACVQRDVLLLDADDKRIVVLATGNDGRQFAVEIFPISGNDRAVIHMPR